MERWILERGASPSTIDHNASISMIDAIGSQDASAFAQSVLSVARNYVRVCHCTVFAFQTHRNPELVSAASLAGSSIAQDAASPYIRDFFRKDEIQNIILKRGRHPSNGNIFVHRQSIEDISDTDYRTACYGRLNITERIANLIRVRHDVWISVNLYRDVSDGRLIESDMEAIRNLSSLFAHSAARHYTIDADGRSHVRNTLADELSSQSHTLTDRERQVVLRILDGYTTKIIALELKISPSTVVTYRARAYEKLGVSCRAELFAAILRRKAGLSLVS
jgi:DNA-binding CsgD family transcriptional regulator